MKNILTLTLILFTTFLYAQKRHKIADKLFEKMWYVQAAKAYEEVIAKGDYSMNVLQKIGDAYYYNTDMENACKWYENLVAEYPEEIEAEYIFKYANTLAGIGNYKKAKKWMQQFTKKAHKEDSRIEKFDQKNTPIETILNLEPQFEIKNLLINTAYSDFGPMYFGDQLVYASVQDSSAFHTRKYRWNEQPYLDLFIGDINALETDVRKVKEFSRNINTRYHEATVAFSPDEKKIYFTRNNYDGSLGKDDDGVSHLKLYSAILTEDSYENQEWVDIRELPFNSDHYSVGHPSVSKDGKKLYFTSDMPGTIGDTDIFVVDILDDNKYSEPKNLGPKINTIGREMFPYITEHALYFSSDSHLGLGGLDVFENLIKDDNFTTSINFGAPLNSSKDDFGYIVREETKKGYFCSNRESGKGDDDIYSFERFELPCDQYINGSVIDQRRKTPVEDVTVKLLDENENIIEETKTKINGSFAFEAEYPCETTYKIEVSKKDYKNNNEIITTTDVNGEINTSTLTIQKELNKLIISENGVLKINIDIIYFDLGKWYIRNDAAIELNKVVFLMNEYPEMIIKIESHTDSRGSDRYNLKLSDRRANATKKYIISQGIAKERIESSIGYGETQLINSCRNGVKCSDREHDMNRRSEFIIVKM
ncbi:OmpA family protein [Aquimarina longa]|uniref:OmpA family protein n=1 Tax=Aquimarina longa TaxID=1080221 RepID=UPI00078156AE|nr:OmpA family protein [Aquimarina longa]